MFDNSIEDKVTVMTTIDSMESAIPKITICKKKLTSALHELVAEYNNLEGWKGMSGDKASEQLTNTITQMVNRLDAVVASKSNLVTEKEDLKDTLKVMISLMTPKL
ncbi:hypothetical protein [Peribacillus frigoritolerans]|uniref:hypothetical protein n=1 Tax=Peribacillus frigoritolerans TaxID=450367 RepID=UPI003305E0A7